MTITDDLNRYQYAGLAATLMEAGDVKTAGISLEKLANDMKLQGSLGADADGFLAGTMVSDEGIDAATKVYAKKYKSAYENATIGDLWNHYSSSDFTDGEKKVYGAKIKLHAGLKIKDAFNKLKQYQEQLKSVLDGKHNLSDADILKLNSEINMYKEVIGLVENSREVKNSTLIENVQKESIKRGRKETKKRMQSIIGL